MANVVENKSDWRFVKAHHAFHNAKGRCCNPNNKDFANYGGAGIKFLLKGVSGMLAAIGLPPTKNHSLDRIDPNGHYVVGNVRWLLKSAQNANKKATHGGATLTTAELIAKYQNEAGAPDVRKRALEMWDRLLNAIARGYFTADDFEQLPQEGICAQVLEAGWELGQERDWHQPPSYFHLPSLTWPGRAIRLRGGPYGSSNAQPGWSGTAPFLCSPEYALGLPPQLVEWTKQDMNDDTVSGAVWEGQVAGNHLMCGGVEGTMLKIASRLRHSQGSPCAAVFLPLVSLLHALDELGPHYRWEDVSSPFLDDRFVFIPDLQLDLGEGFDLAPKDTFRIATFLEYRRRRGLKTFVGVQNVQKLPKPLAKEVLVHLNVRELVKVFWEPIQTGTLSAPSGPKRAPKMGRYDFAQLVQACGE